MANCPQEVTLSIGITSNETEVTSLNFEFPSLPYKGMSIKKY
jgi:hypothetical protein